MGDSMKNTNELLQTIDRWEKIACDQLLGKKIVKVRYLNKKDIENLGWYESAIAFQLDDGNWIFPSQDDEGNGAGALFTCNDKNPVLPVIQF
jgi:hypothetical protein